MVEDDYTERVSRRHGEKFLGSLLDELVVKESELGEFFRECAIQTYWTTFTDDSDYLYDTLGLMALKDVWESEPNKRDAIVCCMDHFYGAGNWIVKMHVNDLASAVGLEDNYKRFR
ncbi:hypothetical protein HOD75_00270 [archaeon]|jgi:hypothetical protein|nr:hypothetical protein [archaeon]MBT4241312.1 hypothetical protein [archaeon]MBT4418133.1 hypothetical protein [archaeon]